MRSPEKCISGPKSGNTHPSRSRAGKHLPSESTLAAATARACNAKGKRWLANADESVQEWNVTCRWSLKYWLHDDYHDYRIMMMNNEWWSDEWQSLMNDYEWMNDWWSDEWLMNDWWMADEVMNDWWMNDWWMHDRSLYTRSSASVWWRKHKDLGRDDANRLNSKKVSHDSMMTSRGADIGWQGSSLNQ